MTEIAYSAKHYSIKSEKSSQKAEEFAQNAEASADRAENAVNDVINSISIALAKFYPVGSVYMGTQSTCPLATLISGSTWEVVATNIVVNVNTNAPVKGTGKALGLTNGSVTIGTVVRTDSGAVSARVITPRISAYGAAVGSSVTDGNPSGENIVVGITTDSSKSGITATVTRTNLTINIWKRTA